MASSIEEAHVVDVDTRQDKIADDILVRSEWSYVKDSDANQL